MRKVCMVAGPRELGADVFRVSLSIDRYFAEAPELLTVIHGDAPGVDRIAAEAAKRHGHTVIPYPVNDDDRRAAKKAGRPRQGPLYRTIRMLDTHRPDWVMAWWDKKSAGTGFTLSEAGRRGIATFVLPANVESTEILV